MCELLGARGDGISKFLSAATRHGESETAAQMIKECRGLQAHENNSSKRKRSRSSKPSFTMRKELMPLFIRWRASNSHVKIILNTKVVSTFKPRKIEQDRYKNDNWWRRWNCVQILLPLNRQFIFLSRSMLSRLMLSAAYCDHFWKDHY